LRERLPGIATVSLHDLLSGSSGRTDGETDLDLPGYTEELLRSGFPAIRAMPATARRAQLNGYLDRIVEYDFPGQGYLVRRPATLRAWLTAYAAATGTAAAYAVILDAATAGDGDKPAKTTTMAYRDVLNQIWLLDSRTGAGCLPVAICPGLHRPRSIILPILPWRRDCWA